MELGFVTTVGSTSFLDGHFANMDFDFKSGFKVGGNMNFDHDSWESSLMYTWFHGTQNQSEGVNFAIQEILPIQGNAQVTAGSTYNSAKEKWTLKMDFADFDIGRTYYVGTKLLFRPAFGARAAWIRQHLNVLYTHTGVQTVSVSQHTTSWALGPRAGLNAQYLIGQGFRFYGNSAADILYTRYTNIKDRSFITPFSSTASIDTRQKNLGYLRPHIELELGLGWGTYLDCNNWYMDFSAGYGFQVFFHQNMFRNYTQATSGNAAANSFIPNGDLFVQGLTATFSLDF